MLPDADADMKLDLLACLAELDEPGQASVLDAALARFRSPRAQCSPCPARALERHVGGPTGGQNRQR
jgi:hypothetical protein